MRNGRTEQYPTDYVLVGASAWLLLSKKFGFDVECKRGVVKTENGGVRSWAVRVSASQLIEIPPTGRFPYEKYVREIAAAKEQGDEDDDGDDLVSGLRV